MKREDLRKLIEKYQYLVSIEDVAYFHKWLIDSIKIAERRDYKDLENRKKTLDKFERIFTKKRFKEEE